MDINSGATRQISGSDLHPLTCGPHGLGRRSTGKIRHFKDKLASVKKTLRNCAIQRIRIADRLQSSGMPASQNFGWTMMAVGRGDEQSAGECLNDDIAQPRILRPYLLQIIFCHAVQRKIGGPPL
jgi:hypothetical protein